VSDRRARGLQPAERRPMSTARYCRCGVRLARDNRGTRCAACLRVDRDRTRRAPVVPDDFWEEVVLREALLARHMGRVVRAWRTHPSHGQHPVPQGQVAAWIGITQAQLSRIETGPPVVHLDRLVLWAQVLRIPAHLLWFALPTDAGGGYEGGGSVKRRDLLASGLTLVGGLAVSPTTPVASPVRVAAAEATQWLAWQLWHKGVPRMHRSLVPAAIARALDGIVGIVVTDHHYAFADRSEVDVLIAHRVFGEIASRESHLLATAQTTHATDLNIAKLVACDTTAQRALTSWARHGDSPVLRVNAAGVLAKVGDPDLGDAVINVLVRDHDARQLYLTAVTCRVLAMPWERAGRLAANLGSSTVDASGLDGHPDLVDRLAAELSSPRDAAARWCCAVLLANLDAGGHDAVRSALGRATRQEPCRENLRVYAAVLAGGDVVGL
jgi:hypothetical protein